MKLKDFVKKFVEHNSVIRLVYKTTNGHEVVAETWKDTCMAWEVLKGIGIYQQYTKAKVIGVTSIYVYKAPAEAVNIVIEKR